MRYIDEHVGERHEDVSGQGLHWGVESLYERLTGLGAKIARATTYCPSKHTRLVTRELATDCSPTCLGATAAGPPGRDETTITRDITCADVGASDPRGGVLHMRIPNAATPRVAVLAGILTLAVCTACGGTARQPAASTTTDPPDAVMSTSGWQALPAVPDRPLVERWRLPKTDSVVYGFLSNGDVVSVSQANPSAPTVQVRRFDPATDKTAWSVDMPRPDPTPQVGVGTGGSDIEVIDVGSGILDPGTGRVVWRGYGVVTGLVDNVLVVKNSAGELVGVDWTTGATRWHRRADETPETPETVVDSHTAVMSQQLDEWNGHAEGDYPYRWLLSVRDLASGALRWQTTLPDSGGSFPVIGNTLITATNDAAIGYDLATGAQRWRTPLPAGDDVSSGYQARPVTRIDTDTVLVPMYENGMVALRASTGALVWRDPKDSAEFSGVRVGGRRYLYSSSQEGAHVWVRDATPGSQPVTEPMMATDLETESHLAAGTVYRIINGSLIATRLPELTERWRVPLHVSPDLPSDRLARVEAVVANGVVISADAELVGYGAP